MAQPAEPPGAFSSAMRIGAGGARSCNQAAYNKLGLLKLFQRGRMFALALVDAGPGHLRTVSRSWWTRPAGDRNRL